MQGNDIEQVPFRGLLRARQDNGSYCGPAVIQMLLSHYGIVSSQNGLVQAAGSSVDLVKERGLSADELAMGVKRLVPGMNFWAKRDATISDLIKIVCEYNFPVVVDWQGVFVSDDYGNSGDTVTTTTTTTPEVSDDGQTPKGDQGHYSVVVDVNQTAGYVRFADPYGNYAGKDRFIAISEFLPRWWDDRINYFPNGEKKYDYVNRIMFIVLPSNLRWPSELGMIEL